MGEAEPKNQTVTHLFAEQLYTGVGDAPKSKQLVTIRDDLIASVYPVDPAALPAGTVRADIAAPGFIDLQINGAADVQFNSDTSVSALERIAGGARQGGTAHLMPTFITDDGDRYRTAISAVEQAIENRVPGIIGVHLEGPFLSPNRPGIHASRFIRPLTPDDVANIAGAQCPVLVTLAPEAQDQPLLPELTNAGVTLFAGHTQATRQELEQAISAGLSGVTHLFNAQSQISGREPGTVGTALMNPALCAGIIADGFHVDPQNVKMAAQLMGDRLLLVSDAMQTLAGNQHTFDLMGTPVSLQDGRLTGPDGTLAGAHLPMDQAVRNAVQFMDVPLGAALRMASGNPARAIGLDSELGRIEPGYRASITCLDADIVAKAVLVDGSLN